MTNERIFPEGTELQEAKVIYTTKELLQRIDHRFDRLEAIAENAATRSEVNKIVDRLNALEQDASGTKAVAKALLESGKDRFSKNEKLVGTGVALVALIPSILAIVQLFG